MIRWKKAYAIVSFLSILAFGFQVFLLNFREKQSSLLIVLIFVKDCFGKIEKHYGLLGNVRGMIFAR